MSTTVSSVTGMSSSCIVPSTATLMSLGHNTSSISSTSVSNLTANNASSVIVATSVTSTPSCSSLNAIPKTTTITTSTSLFPGIAVSSISGACSTTSVLLPLAGSIIPSTTNSAASTFSTSINTPSSTSNTCSTSSKYDTKDDHVEYARSCRAIIDLGGDILRYLLNRHILPVDLPRKVKGSRMLSYRLNPQQLNLINNTPNVGYTELDISLLFSLLRNLCSKLTPTQGWNLNTMPLASETNDGDDIQRIRILRNEYYSHVSDTLEAGRKSTMVRNEMRDICLRMDNAYGTMFSADMNRIQKTIMDSQTKCKDDAEIESLKRKCECLEDEVESEKQRTEKISTKKKKKCKRIKRSMTNGRYALERHLNLEIMQRSELEKRCLDNLKVKFCLLVTGGRGSGKTTLCLEIISQLSEEESFDFFMLEEPDEWPSIKNVCAEENVIFIDDFCNERTSLSNTFENWNQHMEDMTNSVKNGKVRIVIATDSHILSELCLSDNCIFSTGAHLFDLTNDWTLSVDEKKEYFLQTHHASNKSCEFSESEIQSICESKPQVGFFRACQTFFREYKNIAKGLVYFKRAETDNGIHIENIYHNDKIQYAVLFCTLIEERFDFSDKCMAILMKVCSFFELEGPFNDAVNLAVSVLHDSELLDRMEEGDSHYILTDAPKTLQIVAKFNIDLFLRLGGFSVLPMIRPSSFNLKPDELCVCVSTEQYPLVSDILFQEFRIEAIKEYDQNKIALSHPACTEKLFLEFLFERLKKNLPECSNERRIKYFKHILNCACFVGNAILLDRIFVEFNEDMTPAVYNAAVKQVIYSESKCKNVLKILVSRKYSRFMNIENILPLLKTSHIRCNILETILENMPASEGEFKDLTLEVLQCRDIIDPLKQTLLSKLRKENLCTLISDLMRKGIHNLDYILNPLRQATTALPSTIRNEVFTFIAEEFLNSRTDPDVFLSLIREWKESKSLTELESGELLRLIFIEPLKKSWNEEYLRNETIRSFCKTLERDQLKVVLVHCFHQDMSADCIENIKIDSGVKFDETDIRQILLELFDTYRSLRYFPRAFEQPFVRNIFEKCHLCVLDNIINSSQSSRLSHVLINFVISLSLCKNNQVEVGHYLHQMINKYKSISDFDIYEAFLSAHWEVEMTQGYLQNFAFCISNIQEKTRMRFFRYVKKHVKTKLIPSFIFRSILQILALQKDITLFTLDKFCQNEDEAIWAVLSYLYKNVRKEKSTIRFMFELLLSRSHKVSSDILNTVIRISLDRRFSDCSKVSFHWIRLFLNSVSFFKNDLLQCMLMNMVKFRKLGELNYNDLGLMFAKSRASEPLVTIKSILKILTYACKWEFEDRQVLLLLLNNSDMPALGQVKLSNILRKIVKHRSVSVIQSLFESNSFLKMCRSVKTITNRGYGDALCTFFLTILNDSDVYSSKELFKVITIWREFLALPIDGCSHISIDLLSGTLDAYSFCGEHEVDLLLRGLCLIKPELSCGSFVSTFCSKIIAKVKGRIELKKDTIEVLVEDSTVSFFLQTLFLFKSEKTVLDENILIAISRKMINLLEGKEYVRLTILKPPVHFLSYDAKRNSEIIDCVWPFYGLKLPERLSDFLPSTFYPSLDNTGIALTSFEYCMFPMHVMMNAFKDYFLKNQNVLVSAFIYSFKETYPVLPYVFVEQIMLSDTPLYTSAEVALVHCLYQGVAKESNAVTHHYIEDEISNQSISLVMLLLLFTLKRGTCNQSVIRYVVPVRCDGMMSRQTLRIVRNRKNDICTVKMVSENMHEISVEVTFHPDGVCACLCLDNFTGPAQYLVSIISALMCSELKPPLGDIHTILLVIYKSWSELRNRRISLPIGGYIINIKYIDMCLIFFCHSFVIKDSNIKDSLMRRIRFLELTWNDDHCRNLGDTSNRTLLGSFKSIEHLLRHLSSTDDGKVFFLEDIYYDKRKVLFFLEGIYYDNELDGLDSFAIVLQFCYHIMSFILDEQDELLVLLYLNGQFKNIFFNEVTFDKAKLTCTNVVWILRHIVLCDIDKDIFMDLLDSYFYSIEDSPKERKIVLERFVDIWDITKNSSENRSNFLEILHLFFSPFGLVRAEIYSSDQLLSAKYLLKYLEISVQMKNMAMFDLLIQHENITSGILRQTIYFLLEAQIEINEQSEFAGHLNEMFNRTLVHNVPLSFSFEDMFSVTRTIEESCVFRKFQHIEKLILSQNKNVSQLTDFGFDYFLRDGLRDPVSSTVYVDVQKPTNLFIISQLFKTINFRNENLIIKVGSIASECHINSYEFGISPMKKLLSLDISPCMDESGRQYHVSSQLNDLFIECDVIERISPLLSSGYDCIELLYFLVDSIQYTLSDESWTHIMVRVVHLCVEKASDEDLLSQLDQAEPDVRGFERFLNTKHGQILIDTEQLGKFIHETIKSYVDSSDIMSLLFRHYNKIRISYTTAISLSETAITTPYVRSAEYIEMFLKEADVTEIKNGDIKKLFDACLRSPCDQSRSLDVILSHYPDTAVRMCVLNKALMESVQMDTIGNHSSFNCFLANHTYLQKDTVFISLVNHATTLLKGKAVYFHEEINISLEKGTSRDMVFVKLLHLYLLHHNYDCVYLIPMKKSQEQDIDNRTYRISLRYDYRTVLTVQFMFSSLFNKTDTDMREVTINITFSENLTSPMIVNMSLRAITNEEIMNPLIPILYEITETVQLSDDELQILFCAMINRKYAGREDYIHSLLSSAMYYGIGEKSATGILRTATCKQRNNTPIIDLFIEEAERCDVHLSESNMKLIISDLCECRHKRTVFYLRKLLQSTITPDGLSDDVFIAALTSYLRDKDECSGILSVLKEYKTDVSDNLRCLLEKLKSDTQHESDSDDEDDENEDDDDSIKLYKIGEIERKTKIIDDIITSYFPMETDPVNLCYFLFIRTDI